MTTNEFLIAVITFGGVYFALIALGERPGDSSGGAAARTAHALAAATAAAALTVLA